MKRADFIKIFGIAVLSPTVLIPDGSGMVKEVVAEAWKPLRWPIYPQKIAFSFQETSRLVSTIFSYVKINRNNAEYLIPVREVRYNDDGRLNDIFDYNAKCVLEKFEVDESNSFLFDNGFVIRYNQSIHKN